MIAPSDSDSILEITSRMPRCHLTWSDANSIRGVVLPSRGIVWSVRATSNEACEWFPRRDPTHTRTIPPLVNRRPTCSKKSACSGPSTPERSCDIDSRVAL